MVRVLRGSADIDFILLYCLPENNYYPHRVLAQMAKTRGGTLEVPA